MAQINLTTTKPVKLKTQEKYCEEDIEIIPNLQEKTIKPTTEKQEVLVDEGYSGLNKVNVDPINVGSKTFTENGQYSASESGVDGWNKITIDVGGSVINELLLPEEFINNNSSLYYFYIGNNKVLVSQYSTKLGLWLFDLTTQTGSVIYKGSGTYSYYDQFLKIGNKVLISSSSTSVKEFISFDVETEEIKILFNTSSGYISKNWTDIGNGQYLFASYRLIGVYDSNTNSVSDYFENTGDSSLTYSNVESFLQLGEDYFSNNTNNSVKTYIYTPFTKTFKISEYNISRLINISTSTSTASYLDWFEHAGENYLIMPYSNGLYYYDVVTKVVTRLYSTGNRTGYQFVNFGDKFLFKYTSNVKLIDYASVTITDVFNNFGSTIYLGKCGQRKALITSGSSSYKGFRMFNADDNTYHTITSDMYGTAVISPTTKGCLYCNGNSSYKGLFYVDELTETFVNKLENVTYSSYREFYKFSNGLFFSTSTSSPVGVYSFNFNTEEINLEVSGGYDYGYSEESICETESLLIVSSRQGHLIAVDKILNTIIPLFITPSGMGFWELCLIEDNKYYFSGIRSSNFAGNNGLGILDVSNLTFERVLDKGVSLELGKKLSDGIYFFSKSGLSSTASDYGFYYYDYITCERIYNYGIYDSIEEISPVEVIIYNSKPSNIYYAKRIKFNPQTKEFAVYYNLGEI